LERLYQIFGDAFNQKERVTENKTTTKFSV